MTQLLPTGPTHLSNRREKLKLWFWSIKTHIQSRTHPITCTHTIVSVCVHIGCSNANSRSKTNKVLKKMVMDPQQTSPGRGKWIFSRHSKSLFNMYIKNPEWLSPQIFLQFLGNQTEYKIKTQMTILIVINNKIIANPEERKSNIDYDQSKPKSKMAHPLTCTNTYNHVSLCVYILGVTMQIHEQNSYKQSLMMKTFTYPLK